MTAPLVWFLYFLAAFGISYTLGYSHLSMPLRTWLADQRAWLATWLLILLECAACTGFHIGWSTVFFGLLPIERNVFHCLTFAFATAASNLVLARFSGLTETSRG